MNVLIKFPTRQRRERFFSMLDIYYDYLRDRDNTNFLVTLDIDDTAMNNDAVRLRLNGYRNLTYVYGESHNKIHAVNRDMESAGDWDILLLASDDMEPVVLGYDQIIRDEMNEHFPDTDGVLWFPDGRHAKSNTISILGRKYYERFGWIYNPIYASFACDEEYRVVADLLGRQKRFEFTIIKHNKPLDNKRVGQEGDESYVKNYTYKRVDTMLWKSRRGRLREIYEINGDEKCG